MHSNPKKNLGGENMKRLIAIILSTALIVGMLAGCKETVTPGTSGSASASASVSAKPVTVSLWVMPQYEEYFNLLKTTYAGAVKAKYPNVTVAVELLSWDAGPEKITLGMATGATPDLLQDVQARLAPAWGAGLSVDISDVAERVKGIMMDGYKQLGMKDGKHYYMTTMSNNGYNFVVNMDLAKSLGTDNLLPADKIYWSYDQFLDFCRKTSAAGKSQGIYATQLWAGSRSSDAAYYSFLMTGGTNITDMTKNPPVVAANTATAEASLAVLKTLIDEKLVPDGSSTIKDEAVDPNFYDGKIVMLLASAGAQTPIMVYNRAKAGEIKGFTCEFYQMPSPTGKTEPKVVSFGTSGFTLFINKNDPDVIQGAKDAIVTWYETPEVMTDLHLKGGSSPVTNNVTLDYGDATLNDQVKRAIEANSKYAISDFGILTGWWSPFRETFYVQLQAYYTGTKTAKQMLADWETTGNAAIAKAIAEMK